jgi:phosphate transport system ATP-binding protein
MHADKVHVPLQQAHANAASNGKSEPVVAVELKEVHYGDFLAVRDSALAVPKSSITAFIGPSGCGKSTVLRSINRMNDLVRSFRFQGQILFRGKDVYAPSVDPVAVRRYIGMVFQQPNPFAMSIFRNVAFGLKLNGYRGDINDRVELALRRAALWDEVNPIATAKIEELMLELKKKYTIVIVTHNLQQAKRVADETAFFYVDTTRGGRTGYLVEHGETKQVFEQPREKHTQDYIAGAFS